MSNILEYKCPNCAGAIKFDPGKQKMSCPYCDAEFDTETLRAYDEEQKKESKEDNINWDSYKSDSGNGDWRQGETDGIIVYSCEACGGEVIGDKSTGAASCPYCGNSVIVTKQFSGAFRPDMVIPFQLDKKAAKNKLSEFLKGKFLLPKSFKAENRIDSITGLYVPYWLFNCRTDTSMRFRATRVHHWEDSAYRYTKTDHYLLFREGDMTFERVPVDGSTKMDNTVTEAVEPFDYSQAVDFQTAYLAGFFADKYDVESEDCRQRANQRIKESAERTLRDTALGYVSCITEYSNVSMNHGDIKYALLPIWMLNTKYRDKMYTFAINGQTGKMVGNLPVDRLKFWLTFLCTSVVGAGLLSLFTMYFL